MSPELRRLQRQISALRIVDDTMPIQWVAILLEVAGTEGLSISQLAEKTGLALSSTSRNVAAMSDWHWLKRPGLGILEKGTDRMDLTKRTVTLSPKGEKLVEQLIQGGA